MKRFTTFFICVIISLMMYPDLEGQILKYRSGKVVESTHPVICSSPEEVIQKKQGFNMRVWLGSNATVGLGAFPDFSPPDRVGLEYPVGLGIEHIFGAGLWIGAIVDTGNGSRQRRVAIVTTGYDWGSSGPRHEMYGHHTESDTFYSTSIYSMNEPNKRNFDDDNDVKIDEDELDGVDNDNDGEIDEDYAAISENDISISYSDIFSSPWVANHVPLGIKVWQKSFAWATKVKEPVLPFEFYIVNIGARTLDSVYIGYFSDIYIGPINIANTYTRNFSAYLAEVRTAYAHNAIDRPSTPYGVTILGTPKPLDSLHYTFQWFRFEENPGTDISHYNLMSSGIIKPDEPIYPGSDTQFLLAFGPFDSIEPGETLKVSIALISGEGIDIGLNNLKENAVKALELYGRGYTTPEVPPSPPLRIIMGDKVNTLEWDWRPSDSKFDPLTTWDDSNKFVDMLPDTHWRKRNPPQGKTKGGRIFEGFRLYRSESPEYNPQSFALIKQYDVDDNLPFEYGTGLQFRFVDSNLVRGRRYWYAVTSFSIPGASILILPDPGGGPPIVDTLVTASMESDIGENVRLVQLPFAPSKRLGDVKVVPNPYRTDVNYTFEGGGWEGLGRNWNENNRQIWFIHLPPVATIRIFSLSGDLITTIRHDDNNRTTPENPAGQEEWNLLSESGRAIASGIYIFTVESDLGTQIGKFVVIR